MKNKVCFWDCPNEIQHIDFLRPIHLTVLPMQIRIPEELYISYYEVRVHVGIGCLDPRRK